MSRVADPRTIAMGATLALIVVAAWLRIAGVGTQLILLDEGITVIVAVTQQFGWIRTHLGYLDHCIPLTLLAKQLVVTHGLDEWGLRLPSVIAGLLLVAVVARAGRDVLSPSETILVTASIALSPYLIYLSRAGRPYAIVMLLFPLACLLAFAWEAQGGRWRLALATGLGVVAAWFHPIILPASGVLALYVLHVWWRAGWRTSRTGDLVLSVGVLLVLGALIIWPFLPSLLMQSGLKTGRGHLDPESLRSGLMLLHATSLRVPSLLWLCLWTLGAARLFARHRSETIAIVAMLFAQGLFVVLAHPTHTETASVWLRYVGHLIPFILLLSTLPIAWALDALAVWLERPWVGPVLASILGGLLFAGHWHAHRYPVPPYASFNSHPYMAYLPRDVRASGLMDSTSEFYEELESFAAGGALIEVPMSTSFPIYGVYQKHHRHPIYTGAVREQGFSAAYITPGVRLNSVVDLTRDPVELPEDARYLIYHKRIRDEMMGLHRVAKTTPQLRYHVLSDARVKGLMEISHGPTETPLPASIPTRFPKIHDDAWVEVYDLSRPSTQPGAG